MDSVLLKGLNERLESVDKRIDDLKDEIADKEKELINAYKMFHDITTQIKKEGGNIC